MRLVRPRVEKAAAHTTALGQASLHLLHCLQGFNRDFVAQPGFKSDTSRHGRGDGSGPLEGSSQVRDNMVEAPALFSVAFRRINWDEGNHIISRAIQNSIDGIEELFSRGAQV